jgi:hypothetical protein
MLTNNRPPIQSYILPRWYYYCNAFAFGYLPGVQVLKADVSELSVLALYKHVLTSTYFSIEGQNYKQTDGVAMGSPLSPVIAISTWKISKGKP